MAAEVKTCRICGCALTVENTYKHGDRRSSLCKECEKAQVKERRLENAAHYREYDRDRAMDPQRVAARKAWAQTEEGKASRKATLTKWRAANRGISRAEAAARRAQARGILKPTPCVCCGAADVVAHHPDYDRALDVVWLCRSCHAKLHVGFARMLREERLPTAPRSVK